MAWENAVWVGYNNRLRTGIDWYASRLPTQAMIPVRWPLPLMSSSIMQAVMSLARPACCMLWVTMTMV